MDLDQHVEKFKADGFTVFEQLHDLSLMEKWKRKFEELQEEAVNASHRPPWWFGNMLEYAPRLMLPALTHPTIWEFTERVFGPFVQLDNLTLAGFPSSCEEGAQSKASGWHRDRWAQMPRSQQYERPHAINAISYLQDMTPAFGPLRVIPGSHRKAMGIASDKRTSPHPDEILVPVKAGDVVLTHGGVIHSGTPNTSGQTRYFFSVFYNLSWLKHTDNHSGPNVQELIKQARAKNDHRMLRLLGQDDQLEARANCGFLEDDEAMWEKWIEQDKAGVQN